MTKPFFVKGLCHKAIPSKGFELKGFVTKPFFVKGLCHKAVPSKGFELKGFEKIGY